MSQGISCWVLATQLVEMFLPNTPPHSRSPKPSSHKAVPVPSSGEPGECGNLKCGDGEIPENHAGEASPPPPYLAESNVPLHIILTRMGKLLGMEPEGKLPPADLHASKARSNQCLRIHVVLTVYGLLSLFTQIVLEQYKPFIVHSVKDSCKLSIYSIRK